MGCERGRVWRCFTPLLEEDESSFSSSANVYFSLFYTCADIYADIYFLDMFLMWHFICFVFIGSRERRDLGEGRVTHLSHF